MQTCKILTFSRDRNRIADNNEVAETRGRGVAFSLSRGELIRTPDTAFARELHRNKQMIGSGIKGLIHYLFSYGHFGEVPAL